MDTLSETVLFYKIVIHNLYLTTNMISTIMYEKYQQVCNPLFLLWNYRFLLLFIFHQLLFQFYFSIDENWVNEKLGRGSKFRISHWSKSLVVSPESMQGFGNHFLTLFFGLFQDQKMDITLGHDCQFVNCKTKISLCLISF